MIFYNLAQSRETLRSWVKDFSESIRLLKEAKTLIKSNPTLNKYIDVVDITEQGSDWVVRGFDVNSIPLKNAVSSSTIATQTRQAAIDALTNQQGEIAQNILKKLNKNSANLHWSPVNKKILIIDMQ